MFESIEIADSTFNIITIDSKHKINTPKNIARTKEELTQLLNSNKCVTNTLGDEQNKKLEVKVVRFVVDKDNKLVFGAEGRPNSFNDIPAHLHLCTPGIKTHEQWGAVCRTAGNAYFTNDNKLVGISNKSGDFHPSFNSLQFVLPHLGSFCEIADTFILDECNEHNVSHKIHVTKSSKLFNLAPVIAMDIENKLLNYEILLRGLLADTLEKEENETDSYSRGRHTIQSLELDFAIDEIVKLREILKSKSDVSEKLSTFKNALKAAEPKLYKWTEGFDSLQEQNKSLLEYLWDKIKSIFWDEPKQLTESQILCTQFKASLKQIKEYSSFQQDIDQTTEIKIERPK